MKKALVAAIVFAVTATVIILAATMSEGVISHNNSDRVEDLADTKYTAADIEQLKEWVDTGKADYFALKSKVKIQCVRKTFQGYYAVILQEDGSKVFIFMNKSLKLGEMLVFDKFKSKADFGFLETANKVTQESVLEFDKNAILLPISAVNESVHIVKEGVIVVRYKTDSASGKTYADNVRLIGNDEITEDAEDTAASMVPYILEIDKT